MGIKELIGMETERKIRYAIVGLGDIAQEDMMPGVASYWQFRDHCPRYFRSRQSRRAREGSTMSKQSSAMNNSNKRSPLRHSMQFT